MVPGVEDGEEPGAGLRLAPLVAEADGALEALLRQVVGIPGLRTSRHDRAEYISHRHYGLGHRCIPQFRERLHEIKDDAEYVRGREDAGNMG